MPWPFLFESLLFLLAAWFTGLGLLPAIASPSSASVEQWIYATAAIAMIGDLALRGWQVTRAEIEKAIVQGVPHARTMAYLEVFASRGLIVAVVVTWRAFRAAKVF